METDDDMHARHMATLRKFHDQGVELADRLHARAVAEADPQAEKELTVAFHRITRSVRQTMALEALLKRQHGRDLRDADEREDVQEATARGKLKPHSRVGDRLIWH